MKYFRIAAVAIAALIPLAAHSADDFPARDIQFVIPWNAGGSNDIAARQLQNIMQKQSDVNLIVENVPGATGSIGMTRVARSAPDGYTVGMGTSSTLAQIAQKLTPLQNDQFTPIARVSVDPLILLVPENSPASDLKGFLEYMKKNPGVSIGTPGTNNLNHIFAEMTARAADTSYINVPYTGGAKVIIDLAGNQIQAAVLKPSESKGQIDAGKVRPLGVFANERLEVMPDIPTFKELGYDVFPFGPLVQMAYVVAPAGIPEEARAKLITLFSKAIESQEFKSFADQNGVVISPLNGEDLTKEINDVQNTLNSVAAQVFKKD
ncbi:tripartite tricarboxylate transporter substrate binding protein [Pusillimonas sp. SM2304]|uniref:Bug family tripartite tricarboxylate transporter substrate binding protein n=1 Tax=Pusillimonas sp. SM2304 TaxID=3073241 RepID=UPI00287452E2|nr:tripartite tricarboxylate transporter substrate binding protein [Pusillimonas sp. SM2304]MDS1139086.1 tripartite tricarboxylate transporter substrate binding protein [Pusillimonas sp. SM2304]